MQKLLYDIFGTQLTTNIIALVAIVATFIIYVVRKNDYKRDAASIILLEIKAAEKNRKDAKRTYEQSRSNNPPYISFPEKLRLMPDESWTKYKYLFIRDFEPEEWDEIGDYYNNCKNFDDSVEHKDSAFRNNETEIRANLQKMIGLYSRRLAEDTKPNPDNDPEITKNNAKFESEYIQKSKRAWDNNIATLVNIYNPDKSFNDAEYYYKLIPESIITSSIGARLKELAGTYKPKLPIWKRIFGKK